MDRKLFFIFLNLFFGIFVMAVTFAQVKDPNLQIEPSPTPPPYCLGPWREDNSDSGYGEEKGRCDEVRDIENARQLHMENDHSYHGNSSPNDTALRYYQTRSLTPCRWIIRSRAAIVPPGQRGEKYCPVLNNIVKLSASAERIQEQGKFTISWEAPWAIACTLSGKAPETGNFSENFDGTNSLIKDSKTYDFVKRGIYTFQFACQGYLDNQKSSLRGTVSRSQIVFVGEISPPPAVTLKAEPVVIKKGESATISWTSENIISLSINQGIGVVPRSGSTKVSPGLTTTYAITGSGEFSELGLARKSVTVRVIAPEAPLEAPPIEVPPDVAPPPPKVEEKPKIDLKVNGKDGPLTLGAPATLTLSWNLDKYCIANGSWLGIKTKAGSENRTEKKPGTYTYKLYCPLVGSDEVVVKLTGPAVSLPVAEASASTDEKNFSRSIRVVRGEKTKIFLSAAKDINNDKLASRDETGKWTSLMINNGQCLWNLDLNQGVPTFDVAIPNPENADDCTIELPNLTFYDKPGVYQYGVLRLVQNNSKLSNIGYINIAVQEAPLPDGPPVIDFRINNLEGPQVILGAPADYFLTWNVRNADSCEASDNWGGAKFPSGSQRFVSSEKKEFTYTLTCTGKLGTSKKSINLKISELPVCDFSGLPLTLSKSVFDQQSVLTWKCQFANTCEISPTVGVVQTFGSARVSPKNTITYTLACQNLEGSSSFDQLIEVR